MQGSPICVGLFDPNWADMTHERKRERERERERERKRGEEGVVRIKKSV